MVWAGPDTDALTVNGGYSVADDKFCLVHDIAPLEVVKYAPVGKLPELIL